MTGVPDCDNGKPREFSCDFDGLFLALHRAVDWLHDEQPGGVGIDDVMHIAISIAEIVEKLVDERNRLRKIKGLELIYPVSGNQSDG